jgi:predicted dithiol-disulfide oxidoreductase (DUF899 family)
MSRAQAKLMDELRELPMVKLTKEYTFETPSGPASLADLFGGKSQLIVYHFMLAPGQGEGCTGCSFVAEHLPDVRHLRSKNTAFTCVSRAPIAEIEAYKARAGWRFPWASSNASDFNYDFHVTLDETKAPVEYNFRTKEELKERGLDFQTEGEQPGMSVFYKDDEGVIYHTYSTYARGLDNLLNTLTMLDVTPLGRQVGRGGPGEFLRNYEYGPDV